VETGGQYGENIDQTAALLKRLDMTVSSMHILLPLDDSARTFDMAHTLGTTDLVCAWMPPERFQSRETIKALCDELNRAADKVHGAGFRFSYHNHHFEFVPMADGSIPHRVMRDYLTSLVSFEVDTYWVQAGGSDPAVVVRELGSRAPLLHLKDGPAVPGQPQTALGEGKVNVPAVVEAGKGHTEWLIVELDECATDIFEALQKSLAYLTSKGIVNEW